LPLIPWLLGSQPSFRLQQVRNAVFFPPQPESILPVFFSSIRSCKRLSSARLPVSSSSPTYVCGCLSTAPSFLPLLTCLYAPCSFKAVSGSPGDSGRDGWTGVPLGRVVSLHRQDPSREGNKPANAGGRVEVSPFS